MVGFFHSVGEQCTQKFNMENIPWVPERDTAWLSEKSCELRGPENWGIAMLSSILINQDFQTWILIG